MAIVNGKVIEILELLQRFGEAHLQQKSERHWFVKLNGISFRIFSSRVSTGFHWFPLVSAKEVIGLRFLVQEQLQGAQWKIGR